jgi:DNA mismatch endonuclease (patch repair protein)
MTDIVDSQTRSRMMAGIRGKDTKPELVLRRSLHALGFRYRLHAKGIPGKPDLVLPKYKAVIFVHGCFWHRHSGCHYASTPATRQEFWASKLSANVARDSAVRSALLLAGWRVATIWECAMRSETGVADVRHVVAVWLQGSARELEVGKKDIGTPKD